MGVDRLARLEWGLLPALGHDPDAPSLHQGMAEDPESFVEVVCAVYRPRTDDSEPDDGDAVAKFLAEPATGSANWHKAQDRLP